MAEPRNQIEMVSMPRSTVHVTGRRITYEMVDKIVANTKRAGDPNLACQAIGITSRTLEDWLKIGRDRLERLEAGQIEVHELSSQQAICTDLFIEMGMVLAEKQIEDEVALDNLVTLRDFRAIKFKLERKYPEKWGKKDHLTIDNGSGSPVSEEPRIVDYSEEIEAAEEFKMLEQDWAPSDQEATDVDIISEEV